MKTITRFAPHKTALTFACLMALGSLVFLIPMSLMMFAGAPMTDGAGNPVDSGFFFSLLVVMPFLYLVFGYIMTWIGACLYNVIARYTGGIQFEISE